MSAVNLDIIDLCTILIGKNINIGDAAHELGLSQSTLQRRLKAKGLTWSDLKSKVKPPTKKHPITPTTQRPVPARSGKLTSTFSSSGFETQGATSTPSTSQPSLFSSGNDPALTGGGATPSFLSSLPPALQEILGVAKDIPSWLSPIIIEELRKTLTTQTNVEWYRPEILNDRQNQIIDAITDKSTQIILVEGDRRTGKSTSVWVGVHETIWNGTHKNWGMWASTEETAQKIHNDVYSDKITWQSTHKLHVGHSLRKTQIINGAFQINASTMSASSGKAYDGIWMDEFHLMLVDHPEVIATVAGILRSEPNLKLVISCNMGTGAYMLLKQKLEPLFESGRAKFFTLLKSDTTHITDEADQLVDILMTASMGKDFADSQLRNQFNGAGTSFHPMSIAAAYDAYDAFINYEQPIPSHIVMGFDPSGAGHPMGWFVGACNAEGTKFWEIESGILRLGDNLDQIDSGERLTPGQIEAFLLMKAQHYRIHLFISESNMNGKDMKLRMMENNIPAVNQNFTTDKNQKKGASRGNMIHISRKIMDDRAMYLCNKEELFRDLTIYDPDEHEKTAKFKGDCADAMIHTFYRLARMSRSPYLRKNTTKTYQEVNQRQ